MTDYVELQVTSNFSFLRGASHPHELVLTASLLGHRAIAITDRNTLAGIVRAHDAARQAGIRLIVGARLDLRDGPSLLCFPTDRAAYGRLCRLLTLGRRRAPKGECLIDKADVYEHAEGQVLVAVPPDRIDYAFREDLDEYRRQFGRALYLAIGHHYRGDDSRRLHHLADLADSLGVPTVATNDVHYHVPARQRLQDVLTCIREKCTIREAGHRLFAHAERHLKYGTEMARILRGHEDALRRTVEIAERCTFSLDELRYEYPDEVTGDGRTPQQRLEQLVAAHAARRYPDGVPDKVAETIARELELVDQLSYASYFLTVHDIVRFAQSKGILCQGRGSAANSAICYVLGITSVDPAKFDLLFERFVSAARNEPPDIDVDFEHERREEVMQYIYEKYGRHRAGLTATVIRYRARGALRDVGKALGLSADAVNALSGSVWGWGHAPLEDERTREAGLDPSDRTVRLTLDLAEELMGFPRHLSQHVGGFVITRGRLDEVVPVENAAMAGRTVIQWDKDDLDVLRMIKVDVLALGMLSCLRRGFDLLERHHGQRHTLFSIPQDDPATYEMLSRGDSIGVFQVESRAQMSMLPRLRPQTFYDLVIEVAIVRPGPIQGDMVHPYLRRRQGLEPIDTLSPELEPVLGRTLGVPIFQEQAMRIAIVAAGFTADEADRLRRSMAAFKKGGDLKPFQDKLLNGMLARGYDRSFAERCCRQLEGFGSYGFPESHAASFAQLVYVSAWLKCHFPDVFCAALLNAQPMGFYAPAQLVRDAREHGVEIRPPDVNRSDWDSTLEPADGRLCAVRLGLRLIRGLSRAEADLLLENRGDGYADPRDLWRRARLKAASLALLADADAFRSMGLDRRQATWAVRSLGEPPPALFAHVAGDHRPEPEVALPAMRLGEHVAQDYLSTSLSLKAHPMSLLREDLAPRGIVTAQEVGRVRPGRRIETAGLVLVRQQPGTASGVIFITIEDETGVANLICWPDVVREYRKAVLKAALLSVRGRVQRESGVTHIVCERLEDLTLLLRTLSDRDRTAGTRSPSLPRGDDPRASRPRQLPLWRSRDFR